MCNCIKEITEKTNLHLKTSNPSAIIDGGRISQMAFFTTGGGGTYNDFGYKIQVKKKDGSYMSAKNKTVALLHSHCPFCGKKYEQF